MNESVTRLSRPTPESVLLSRWYPAPAALLWTFWTDPGHIVRWFGPATAAERSATADLRVGGAWGVDFRANGALRQVRGVYQELDAPRRLVSSWAWIQDDGSLGPESRYELAIAPEGDGARLNLTHTLPDADLAARHGEGWSGSFDTLHAVITA